MGIRHQDKVTGYIWAETNSEVPSTGLEWKTKDGNTDVEARIECLNQGKSSYIFVWFTIYVKGKHSNKKREVKHVQLDVHFKSNKSLFQITKSISPSVCIKTFQL